MSWKGMAADYIPVNSILLCDCIIIKEILKEEMERKCNYKSG